MALPYKLYGGATRADAISGLNPAFAQALTALYNAAPPEVQAELGLNSAYRSPEVQRVLWEKSDKTGRTVAAPGRSKHQSGLAADLYGFGLSGGGQVSQATKDWVKANAAAHGLYFPMSYEPWHVQLQDGGAAPAVAPGGVATTMASAVDPRVAVMAQMEGNPWKSITDAASKRGGLVGEASAGGGLSAPPTADPDIPPLETASARLTPDALLAQRPPNAPAAQLGQLAQLFKVKPIGQAAAGQALPLRKTI
jgi:hypothetical protein